MLHIKQTVCYCCHNVVVFSPFLILPLLRYPTCNNAFMLVRTVCSWSNAGCASWLFIIPSDRDLLFAHVQTSAGAIVLFYDHLCWVAMAPRPLAPKSNPVQCFEIPDVG